MGRHLAQKWAETHENRADNPWALDKIKLIKDQFDSDEEGTKAKYPELFYYFDGLINTKISQSVHPAGMVISPITLSDNFGTFNKDGENCLMLDMENIHDFTGLAKYDFLILKTVEIIRDTCSYLGEKYPKSHEVNWEDQDVWSDMSRNGTGIFQMESPFAHDCLKKFKPKNLFDMSLVTACIRPSGASYRDDLLARKPHHNPSEIIDDLLKDNLGYLCIEGNQKVDTRRGLIPIKDVKAGDFVITRSGERKVLDARKTGHKKLVSVNYLGTSLVCTPEHKLLTDHGWVEAGKIGENYRLAYRTGECVGNSYDINKAKILGWLIGFGIIKPNRTPFLKSRLSDSVRGFKLAVEKAYSNLIVKKVIVKKTRDEDGIPFYRGTVRFRDSRFNNENTLYKELDELGLLGLEDSERFIPDCIMNGNREVVKAFLGAYTDMSCRIKIRKAAAICTYTTLSIKLAESLQNLIRMLGFPSRIYTEKNTKNKIYRVMVGNARDYFDELYKYSVKIRKTREKLLLYIEVPYNDSANNIDIELVKGWLDDKGIGRKKVFYDTGTILYGDKKSLGITAVREIINRYEIPDCEMFLNKNLIWTRIDGVTPVEAKDVYDITVEDEHEFVCQGIIVHNCYQEDTIKFLQQICGLSGSESDNIRRGIGRKQKDRLEEAMPRILEGYCSKSDKPREEAEREAKEFLQIIEDSANYQFG